MTQTLAFACQKGGVGKTTLALNVAGELATRGNRVLAVDCDPQASLTRSSGVVPQSETLATVLGQNTPGSGRVDRAIVPVDGNLHILPAETLLAQTELGLVLRLNRERQLHTALRRVVGQYDYIVIDSPPSLGLLTINVLMTAQAVVVPTILEIEGVQGAQLFLRTVQETMEIYPEAARLLGIVVTMVDLWKDSEPRQVAARDLLTALRGMYGSILFETIIPRSSAVPESMLMHQTLQEYAPSGRATIAISALTDEIVSRSTTR